MMNDNLDLAEEVFCLKFELDALSSVLIKHETERWVPGFMHAAIEKDHIDRYIWACNYVSGRNVLDIACGTGKGSYLMATKGGASGLTACDLNPEAIRYAKHRNSATTIRFNVQDALELPWKEEFDVVVSFETIEHVSDVTLFLKGVFGALKKNGFFLVSTPISDVALDKKPDNVFHIQEWGFMSFRSLLSEFFVIDDIFLQLYDPVPSKQSPSIWKRIRHKLKRQTARELHARRWSAIEKYSEQYSLAEIGTIRKGYQVVVCRKG